MWRDPTTPLPRPLELLPPWLPAWLPTTLALSSALLFVVSLALVPLVLVRLPADYFLRPAPRRPLLAHVARNLAGGVLVALGLVLLVLPGQGMLTVLLGLSILDLPMKRRLLRRILRQRNVRGAVQKLRTRAHRPPLLVPDEA